MEIVYKALNGRIFEDKLECEKLDEKLIRRENLKLSLQKMITGTTKNPYSFTLEGKNKSYNINLCENKIWFQPSSWDRANFYVSYDVELSTMEDLIKNITF